METNNKENFEKISDYVTLNVKHIFTEDELKEQSNLLAQGVKNKTQEEANKKVAMADFANKIKSLEAQINVHSGHINNGYTYTDRVCELYLDFENKIRIYDDKQTGQELKREPFHQSDFEKRQLKMNMDEQIEENNSVHDFANNITGGKGTKDDPYIYQVPDPLYEVIETKKGKGKPKPKDTLPDDYGKNFEFDEQV
jgi:hypothetical protein